ncbi:MAG: hypothetical protein ABIP51_23760 [Bacteroidia bacterium]
MGVDFKNTALNKQTILKIKNTKKMKKQFLIVLLLISSITFAQTSDRATSLTAVDMNTVSVNNLQSCSTPYLVNHGDTTYISDTVMAGGSLLIHSYGCRSIRVTPLVNCDKSLPKPAMLQICPCSVLPVSFKSIDGNRKPDGSINILFQMGDQTNIKKYIIWVSPDGKNFTKQTVIPINATGTSYLFNFTQNQK